MLQTRPWEQTVPDSLDLNDYLIHEPADEYHARAGEYLSSHQLGDFRKSPLLYRRKRLGLIPDVDRPAYLVGRATHTLILEGRDRFNDEYAVGGPINPKTGRVYGSNTKAFADWAEEQNKPVITDTQFQLMLRMHLAVAQNELASDLLSFGVAEAVVRRDYCDIPCQIRMDWFRPDCGIVDLKTCDDLDWFQADARRFGYVYQMAFYRAVLAEVLGRDVDVHFVAVEKKEPHRCGVWKIAGDVLDIAREENEAAIERLLKCERTDRWPSGYEELRLFETI